MPPLLMPTKEKRKKNERKQTPFFRQTKENKETKENAPNERNNERNNERKLKKNK
jgi:hypothetical protein